MTEPIQLAPREWLSLLGLSLCLLAALPATLHAAADEARTALYLDRTVEVTAAPSPLAETAGLWVTPEELTGLNDFVLKPEGACLDELCIPVKRTDAPGQGVIVVDTPSGTRFDALAFAEKTGQPVAVDQETGTVSFGAFPVLRQQFLDQAIAPDFELPDASGKLHRLSDHRGKKVLIVTWASW